MILESFAIAAGGTCGALLRGWLMLRFHPARVAWRRLPRRFGPEVATWIANVLGCLLLGLWIRFAPETPAPSAAVAVDRFVAIGFCGGLTTFSTVCADAFRLRGDASSASAIRYLALTVIVGAAALHVGLFLMR